MEMRKIYLTKREREVWLLIKQIFINEDQVPTPKMLAEELEVTERYAKQILQRFHEFGLLVKNSMDNYRFARARSEILIRRSTTGREL